MKSSKMKRLISFVLAVAVGVAFIVPENIRNSSNDEGKVEHAEFLAAAGVLGNVDVNAADSSSVLSKYQTSDGYSSSNINGNGYVYNQWAKTVKSYLNVDSTGYERVEYNSSKKALEYEKLDSNFKVTSSKEISFSDFYDASSEAQFNFGGFFYGANYNFAAIGFSQTSKTGTDSSVKSFILIRYSKDFTSYSALSIGGINTYIPFDAGSLRMVELNGTLYIDTCHEMYQTTDGYNHQANMRFIINEGDASTDMSLTNSFTSVMNDAYGYCSHSFNQYIVTDGTNIYMAEHGDAYPRGIYVAKYNTSSLTPISYATSYVIPGEEGDNATGVTLGGMEVAGSNIICAMSSVDCSDSSTYSTSAKKNIMLLINSKSSISTGTVKNLTNYTSTDTITVSNPQLVKVSDNKLLVMWNETDSTTIKGIKACLIDSTGALLSDIIELQANISDCQPQVSGDKVIWYVTNSSSPTYYVLDTSDVTKFNSSNSSINLNGTALDDFTYKVSTSGITITAYNGSSENIDLSFLNDYDFNVSLSSGVFKENTTIKSVILPDNMTSMGNYTFMDCTSLTSVTLPSKLTSIGMEAFYGCSSLTSISIPSGVTSIGWGSFYGCKSLTSVVIPENVTSISTYAFYGCTSLKNVVLEPTTAPTVASNSFPSAATLVVPDDGTGYDGTGWTSYSVVKESEAASSDATSGTTTESTTKAGTTTTEATTKAGTTTTEATTKAGSTTTEATTKAGTTTESTTKAGTTTEATTKAGATTESTTKAGTTTESTTKAGTTTTESTGDSGNQAIDIDDSDYGSSASSGSSSQYSYIYFGNGLKGKNGVLQVAPAVKKIVSAKKALTVTLKKNSNVSGYQIQYSLSKTSLKKGKKSKSKKVYGYTKVKVKLKNLKKKKKYYVRVRAFIVYYNSNGKKKTLYSKWSTIKCKKTK